jgi:hypothetical protein
VVVGNSKDVPHVIDLDLSRNLPLLPALAGARSWWKVSERTTSSSPLA